MASNDINKVNLGLSHALKVYCPHMQMKLFRPKGNDKRRVVYLAQKLKTYLPQLRCISLRRHTLRMSIYLRLSFELCRGTSLMQAGKPTCGNMRLGNYSN